MAADEEEDGHLLKLLASSPEEDFNPLVATNGLPSPTIAASESSEKSDNSLSDMEEKNTVLMEYELYGKTPPSSRTTSKLSRENNRSMKRRSLAAKICRNRRQSANAVYNARAFGRSLKNEESSGFLLNEPEDILDGRQRLRSSTESSITRKPSQRIKYSCLKYKELNSSGNLSCGKDMNSHSTVCHKRLQFYDTLNLLINLGQGTNSEAKEKMEDEDETYEVEELKEALWLELQAWHNNTTMLEQDEYLMSARTNINSILEDVINFKVDISKSKFDDDKVSSDSESETDSEEGFCVFHCTLPSEDSVDEPQGDAILKESVSSTTDLEMQSRSNSVNSCDATSPEKSPPSLSEFAQSVKTAVTQVSSIVNKLYSMEQLYPSRGALRKDFEKYNSEEFNRSLDTMTLWLNMIQGLYHKLHVMSKLVQVDMNDEEMWKDWIELGLGLKCLRISDNECRRCQEVASNHNYDVAENSDGFQRGLSYEISSTSRYRQFVDQNIKKMGVAKLGYKMHEIMNTQLSKAVATLQVDRNKNIFADHKELHKLFHSLLVKSMNGRLPNFDPRDENMYGIENFGIAQDNWAQRFQEMGLPSYGRLYIFLVRLVMDIYHECLRMRMEHRPKGEPSSLSVRQLIEECKEVLTAAVVVRQFFLDSLETIGQDLSICPKFEEGIIEFEQDIQNMLEVYFEYLHVLMHMLQRLPEASCGVKNIMEEEWCFVKQLTPYIRGGEVQAGKRFCVMACGLMESTADFLEAGMDAYFSGLHDTEPDEKLMIKVLQSCRDLKKLFKETRERSVKALAFVKSLKNDLGVAATFAITVEIPELLGKLKAAGYIQVVTTHAISVMMFVHRSLANSKSCINELLNACCGLHCQKKSCSDGMQNYIVLVHDRNGTNWPWTGDKIDLNPAFDTSIAFVDIQVDELAIVACNSSELQFHLSTFQEHAGETVRCLFGTTSCHHDLIEMEKQIGSSIVNLRKKICDALDGAVENFDVDKMYDIEEVERTRLCRSLLEALQFAFNVVFDFHREIKKIPDPVEPGFKIAGKYFLELASKWVDFVVNRCEKGKGRRPRWAIQGLKFLIEACHPGISHHLSDSEFEKFQEQIHVCIDHVIGSAEQFNNPATPNSSGTSYWFYSKISRSSTYPGAAQSPHSHPTRAFSEPGRRTFKRSVTMGESGDQSDDEEEIVYPQMRILRVRSCIADLENHRHQRFLDKGVIGRISNKKRDLAGELAVIPKRVPFKWQRGNKIGEGQFGKVYACVNLDTEEVVAMKQITFHPNDHSSFQDLADEIKAFENLNHDSLVKYYGCEVHRDVMYIFMEYCGDGTISDVSRLGLPEAMIRKYADQILIAVEFLHDRGIVHRDIKGPNIFLSSEGLIKLGDFGASVKLVDPSRTMCGEVSTLRGTIAYMAPEVITLDRGVGYGRAADIWSVGCVVVEMASGKPPWTEYDNQWAIMLKVGEGASPSVPERLSEEGKDFLANCFVHDPHERWTARQLQNHTFLKCD